MAVCICALTAFLLIIKRSMKYDTSKRTASNAVEVVISDQWRSFVFGHRPVTAFDMAWSNNAPFKFQTYTSPHQTRRKKKYNVRGLLCLYVSTASHRLGTCCSCFVTSSYSNRYRSTRSGVVTCSGDLHRLFSVITPTISLAGAAVSEWTEYKNSVKSNNPAVEDTKNSGVMKHSTNGTSNVRLTLATPASFTQKSSLKKATTGRGWIKYATLFQMKGEGLGIKTLESKKAVKKYVYSRKMQMDVGMRKWSNFCTARNEVFTAFPMTTINQKLVCCISLLYSLS